MPGRQTATPPRSGAAGWAPTGLKIAIFGLGGYGAVDGFVVSLGGTIIGEVLGLPSLLVWADGPAYRKTVPTVIMLLARTRVKLAQKQRAGEASDGLITAA